MKLEEKNTIEIVVLVIKLCISHYILTLKYLNLPNGNHAYKQYAFWAHGCQLKMYLSFWLIIFVNFIIKTTVNDK
jgi:hypothetical protein